MNEAQVFRMHRDKRLEALRRAYASLLGDEPEALSFRMSCALHGQLDRAASYVKRQWRKPNHACLLSCAEAAQQTPWSIRAASQAAQQAQQSTCAASISCQAF